MRYYLFLLLCMVVSKPLYATAWGTDCSYETKTVNVTIPSGKKVSIDPNAPLGTVFFEHYIAAQSGLNFICQSAHNYTFQRGYTYGEGGQTVAMSAGGGLVSQNGSTYPVYKTNVPGIGLVVRVSNYALPYSWSAQSGYFNTDYSSIPAPNFDIDVIKYGDIPLGARTVNIDSTVLPVINYSVRVSNSGNTSQLPDGDVPLVRFVLSPSTFDILTATCDTPDVSVNLGSRKLSDTTNREGGKFATPWVDASIRLVNCPVFYGTGERGSNKDIVRDNVMTVTLIPNNATSSNQGIMPVDTSGLAAQGVGIQLAYGTSASPQFVDFSTGQGTSTYTMSSTQGASYTIPLVARYMQTASNITDINVGQANGKITYLINYY